jgi:predicted dithiol-disulfide oxidoreductase (DUF899 family)
MNTATAQAARRTIPPSSSDAGWPSAGAAGAREGADAAARPIARERRALPWVRIEKDYVFDTPDGPRSLAELFEAAASCWCSTSCSARLGARLPELLLHGRPPRRHDVHLAQRDVTLRASRARRWRRSSASAAHGLAVPWVSSHGSDFNHDFGVSFTPEAAGQRQGALQLRTMALPERGSAGLSVFYQDDCGAVFHTYSTYGRGVEVMMGTYNLLDLTPKGRDEHNPATPWTGCATTTATSRAPAQRRRDQCVLPGERLKAAPGAAGDGHGKPLALAGGRRRRRPARAEPGQRLDAGPPPGACARATGAQPLRALLPIALGHLASIALVAGAVYPASPGRGWLQVLARDCACPSCWRTCRATPRSWCARRRATRDWRSGPSPCPPRRAPG